MADIYYDNDANLDHIKDEVIGVIGYGSQGHAHALNLKDSGANVMVGLYRGSKSWQQAESDGLEVGTVEEVAQRASIIMMLIPDTRQKQVYDESIAPHLDDGKTLMFAHGFNIHYSQIVPPPGVDVDHDRSQGARASRPAALRKGSRHPRPVGHSPGRHRGRAGRGRWATPRASARQRRASSKRRSPRKPSQTCSANRPSSAAASAASSRPVLRRWSRRATSRRSPISSACMR